MDRQNKTTDKHRKSFSIHISVYNLQENICKIIYETQCDTIAINLLLHFHQNMPAFWKILFKYFSGNMGIIFAFFSLSCQIKNVRKAMKYIFKKASIILGKLGNKKYLFQLKEGSCRAGGFCVWNTFVADVLIPSREPMEKVIH